MTWLRGPRYLFTPQLTPTPLREGLSLVPGDGGFEVAATAGNATTPHHGRGRGGQVARRAPS